MESPDSIAFCARHGFQGVTILVDSNGRAVGIIRDWAPDEGREAALRHSELVLSCGTVLGWGEGAGHARSADKKLVRELISCRGQKGHAPWIVAWQCFSAKFDRCALNFSDLIEDFLVKLPDLVSEGVLVSLEG